MTQNINIIHNNINKQNIFTQPSHSKVKYEEGVRSGRQFRIISNLQETKRLTQESLWFYQRIAGRITWVE